MRGDTIREGESNYRSEKQKKWGLSKHILEPDRSGFKPHQLLFPYYVIQGNLTPLHLTVLQYDPLAWGFCDIINVKYFVVSDQGRTWSRINNTATLTLCPSSAVPFPSSQ